MKLFKGGISAKWLLLIIGIVAVSGIAIATTNPSIGDSINYLDALNTTRWIQATQFIDADNPAYYVNPAGTISINVAGDIQNTFTKIKDNAIRVEGSDGVSININDKNYDGSTTYYRNLFIKDGKGTTILQVNGSTQRIFYPTVPSTSGTDDIACIDPTTEEFTKNTGSSTTCAVSAEKYKDIKGTFNDSTIPNKFSQLHPIIFNYKEDVKHLEKFGFNANEIAVLYPQVVYTRYHGNGTFVKVILNQSNPNKADSILYSDGVIADIEGINFEMLSAILVNQVQNQEFQIDIQASQIRNICTNQPSLCS